MNAAALMGWHRHAMGCRTERSSGPDRRRRNQGLLAVDIARTARRATIAAGTSTMAKTAPATNSTTLLAEETRLGMLVGVAVGWELARVLEIDQDDQTGE